MIANRKYRFYIINTCETIGGSVGVSGIAQSTTTIFTITGHSLQVGQWIKLTGFKPSLDDIVTQILSITTNTIQVEKIPAIDESVFGDVTVLYGPRYVDPLNFYNTRFIWDKQGDEIFFRKKLEGKLKFNNPDSANNDFDYFTNYILTNECCKVKFFIEKKCSEMNFGLEVQTVNQSISTEQNWNIEWSGYLTHNMGTWNLSHCHVETDIETDDEYTCLMDNKTEDVNVLHGTETHSVKIPIETTIEEVICCKEITEPILMGLSICYPCTPCGVEYTQSNGNTLLEFVGKFPCIAPPDSSGWGFGGDCCDIVDGPVSDAVDTSWAVKKLVITNVGVDTCIEDSDVACIQGTFCMTFIREVLYTFDVDGTPQEPDALGGNTWANAESLLISGLPATKWVRSPSTTWDENVFAMSCVGNFGTDDLSEMVFDYSDSFPPPAFTTYDTGRTFSDVVSLVSIANCGRISGVRSDFFEINPVGDTPGYVAGINYVTGLQNKLSHMLFIQMSDYINPSADQPAFIGNLKFEEITRLWRIAFNAYWFVDDDGYIRVEHISWFNRNVAIDTTTNTGGNRHRNKSLKVFDYNREEIPIREEFKWQHQGGLDFTGVPIKYNSPCANPKNIARNDLEFVSTDTTYLTFLSNPEDKVGFALVCLDPNDLTTIDSEVGLLSLLERNNGHLSWANLHYNYHRYDRWLINGNMNNISEMFFTAKKTKRQVPIKYAGDCCVNIRPQTDLVVSELGDGQIGKMSKDNRDELYTFELLFD